MKQSRFFLKVLQYFIKSQINNAISVVDAHPSKLFSTYLYAKINIIFIPFKFIVDYFVRTNLTHRHLGRRHIIFFI